MATFSFDPTGALLRSPDQEGNQPDLSVEEALVEASHLLLSSQEVDLQAVLRFLGGAVKAQCAYLVRAVWNGNGFSGGEAVDPSILYVWHRDGDEAERSWRERRIEEVINAEPNLCILNIGGDWEQKKLGTGQFSEIAVPLLTDREEFIGYLGVEGLGSNPDRAVSEYGQILSLFGKLLSRYFSRIASEQALKESEERWRNLIERHPDPIIVSVEDKILYANEACLNMLGIKEAARLLDYTLQDFIAADQYDKVRAHWESQQEGVALAPFQHDFITLSGEERVVESVAVPAVYKGHAACQIVFRDITERKRSEERYRSFVETISEAIWHFELKTPIRVEALPETQVNHILENAYLQECNQVMVQLVGAKGAEEVVGDKLHALLPHLSRKILYKFVRSKYVLQGVRLSVMGRKNALRHFIVNAVGEVNRDSLVGIWGSSIEITHNVELERRLVASLEEQQERIGRDLHDSVGQFLTGIRLLSACLVDYYLTETGPARDMALKLTTFADDASASIRNIYRGLAPPTLYHEGLNQALRELIEQVNAASPEKCILIAEGDVQVDSHEVKVNLYRIVQEAVNNAVKHAQASTIRVVLKADNEQISLLVQDDGKGFNTENIYVNSLGLYGMRRRASSINATLELESSPDQGTTVHITLPRSHFSIS